MTEFEQSLHNSTPQSLYRRFLLGHDIWYFREYLKKRDHASEYDRMKILMSDNLGIHPNNIAIVGSAKLGFSITPKQEKYLSPFSENSDIDIAIVSPEIFRDSWSAFLDLASKGYLPSYKNVTSNVFRRFVSLKYPDHRSDYFRKWNGLVEPCKKDLQLSFSISNDINYRIYESWEAVEYYHCQGIQKLQKMKEGTG